MNIKKIITVLAVSFLLASCELETSAPAAPAAPEAPAAPAALTLSFTPIKGFHFTWTDVSSATYYKLKEAKTVGSGYTIVDDNIASTGAANSFDLVVPLYDRLNSKYILESCNLGGCIASDEVFTSTKIAEMVSSIGYIKPSTITSNSYFGNFLALSGDGNTLAVGAWGENSNAIGIDGDETDNSASSAGAVYVFTRSGTTWTQQAYVKASNTDASDFFGYNLSLSDDGNTLAVNAIGERSNAPGIGGDQTDNSNFLSGAVYVFIRSGTTWTQQAYVKASNTGLGDFFGVSLSLSGDGNSLAVGAAQEDSNAIGTGGDRSDNSSVNAGAVYVFTRSGTTWTQQAYVKASNTDALDEFGSDVSLSNDGNTLAVGASKEGSNATGIGGDQSDNSAVNAGAVYVFTRSGTTWTQQAYVKASYVGSGDLFGGSLSLNGDGNSLAVGASSEDSNATGTGGDQSDNSASEAGAVYVFTRSGTTWTQQAYVKASNTDASDEFGSDVSLSNDGNSLAVGAAQEGSNAAGIGGDQSNNSTSKAGAVYLY